MSKPTIKGYDMANFAHVTPEMIYRAESVVADQKRKRYSASAVFKSHNEVFKLREQVSTCASCLVQRATNLTKWLDWYNAAQNTTQPDAGPAPVLDDNAINEEVFAGLGLTDSATPQEYSAAIKVLLSDPTQSVAEDRKQWLINKAAAIDAEFPPATQQDATQQDATQQDATQQDATQQAKRIVVQPIDKATYETKGDPLYAYYTGDDTKGIAMNPQTGKALAPGTYATEDPKKLLTVAIGGKAAYKTLE